MITLSVADIVLSNATQKNVLPLSEESPPTSGVSLSPDDDPPMDDGT